MKNFINYLKRVFRVIFNIKEPEQKVIEPQEPTLERVKQLIDKTAVKEKSPDLIDEGFIANRKAINEYKGNYSKFVGYNKPPEPLKSSIDADNKMDVTELNIEQMKFVEEDKVRYDRIREREKLEEENGDEELTLQNFMEDSNKFFPLDSNFDIKTNKKITKRTEGILAEIEKLNVPLERRYEANTGNTFRDLIDRGKEALERVRIAEEENRIRKI